MNGNCASASPSAGARNCSAMPSTDVTISYWVTSSTKLTWYTPFSLSRSPWCTESTRRYPGFPKGSGFLRTPMATLVAWVFSHVSERLWHILVPRRLYRCATEMLASCSRRRSPYTRYMSESVFWSARPFRRPSALSTSAMRATSSTVYTRGNTGWVRSFGTMRPQALFRALKRSSWVSEYPVMARRYWRTIPFSFFESPKYRNFPRVRPIHSYASARSVLRNRVWFESFTNSLSSAMLTIESSCMLMVIQPAWSGDPAEGSPLGSLYAGIGSDFSPILHWRRLALDTPLRGGL